MVLPRDQVRRSIIERGRYSPECPNKALRGSTRLGVVEVTIKEPGDHVISNIGVSKDEQPSRPPRTQIR
jgi:hypothetical protein